MSRSKGLQVIISGAPASGKGTQCEMIKDEYNLVHLSTGDMLRDAASEGTELGLTAKGFMDKGELVPDELIVGVVKERLQQQDCMERGWLLDGFPRTRAQADALVAEGIKVDSFVLLDVPDDVLIKRVVGRRMDPETGKIYHMDFNPPETEEIAARVIQRDDDTEEKAQTRLKNFYQYTDSIKSVYQAQLLSLNGNKDKRSIFYEIKTVLDQLTKMNVIFVLGGPGSGKGTQCANMVRDYGYIHLSAGDLLRAERNSGSENAELINSYIKEGKIVPVEITVGLIKNAMEASGGRKFLIDGFPRSIDNTEGWFNVMADDVNISMVLLFDCPEEVMTQRLLKRGETSGRVDDNMEAIVKRFRTFKEQSMPVVEMLSKLGLVRTISSVPPVDVVYKQVRDQLEGLKLVPPVQRTLAMIKPDAVRAGKADEIIKRLQDEDFVVIAKREATLTRAQVEEFYAEHQGKSFFENLASFMTSGPMMALCLEKVGAIKGWRALMGPTNTEKAKAEAPDSLRAKYGTDGTQNATHGSDSTWSALRELNFHFPGPLEKECTLAMIKPHTALVNQDKILAIIAAHGYKVICKSQMLLTNRQVSEFYAEHQGKSFFPTLTNYMTSGETVALLLQREGAIKGWRSLMGPTNSLKARESKPQSIRGMFGIDGTMNATHGSDSPLSAAREIMFHFPSARNLIPSNNGGVSSQSASEQEILDYMRDYIDPIFAPLLQKILIERPADVREFALNVLGK
mmetsp:Transcript_32547/g.40891  ORF Transcript_32547/g.40891 Transcript_32547/m.40891 type:complete len:740 (-) Transcript_32547:287-2506(-)